MSAILPYGSQYWMAVRYGNLELLRHALCLGQYRISDTTIYGDTSLHVCCFRLIAKYATDFIQDSDTLPTY
jgi:hypothetical protein